MRRISSVFAVAVLAVPMLASCAGSDDDSEAAPADTAAAAESPSTAPDEGSVADGSSTDSGNGTLVYAAADAPTTLDPHLEAGLGEVVFFHAVWDRLFIIDESRQVQPGLAIDTVVSDDGLSVDLELRTDAMFHNGSPVDAESVKLSLERGRDMETSTAASDLAIVENVEVVDDHRVRLTLTEPAPYLSAVLATKAGSVIAKEGILADADLTATASEYSSGPFLVDEFVPNERLVLSRAPQEYWDSEATQLESVSIEAITDPQAALNALLTGEVDVIGARGSTEEAQAVADENPEFTTYLYPTGSVQGVFLRNTIPPLEDPLVRQAIAHALDRQAASEGLFGDDCIYNPAGVLPGSPGYMEGYDPFPYDPDRARALLAEAGLEDGLELEFMTLAGFPSSERLALAVQQDLAAVGIDLSLRPVSPTDVVEVWTEGNTQAYISGLGAGADDYLSFSRWMFGTWSLAGPEDADVTAAMSAAATPNLSDDDRTEAYQQLTRASMELATMIPYCNSQSAFIARDDVTGMERLGWTWSTSNVADLRYLGREG